MRLQKKECFTPYGENCAFELINEKPVKLNCEKNLIKMKLNLFPIQIKLSLK